MCIPGLCVAKCCIRAKHAEKKANLLIANELPHPPMENGASSIVFPTVLEAEILSHPQRGKGFPLESFPAPLQEVILQTKECLSFPVSYMGTSLLFAASVAIGNTYRVVVKKGFDVPAVLYCALVGKPGVTKTHPLKFAINPIMDWDKENQKRYPKAMKQYEEYPNLDKTEKKNAEKPEGKGAARIPYKYICAKKKRTADSKRTEEPVENPVYFLFFEIKRTYYSKKANGRSVNL